MLPVFVAPHREMINFNVILSKQSSEITARTSSDAERWTNSNHHCKARMKVREIFPAQVRHQEPHAVRASACRQEVPFSAALIMALQTFLSTPLTPQEITIKHISVIRGCFPGCISASTLLFSIMLTAEHKTDGLKLLFLSCTYPKSYSGFSDSSVRFILFFFFFVPFPVQHKNKIYKEQKVDKHDGSQEKSVFY